MQDERRPGTGSAPDTPAQPEGVGHLLQGGSPRQALDRPHHPVPARYGIPIRWGDAEVFVANFLPAALRSEPPDPWQLSPRLIYLLAWMRATPARIHREVSTG